MRLLVFGLSCVAVTALSARDQYQVIQENKNYQAWREKAFFGSSSNPKPSSSAPVYQPPVRSQADYSREASNRVMRERNKEYDSYNARVAEENARVEALNKRYQNRSRLNALALAGNVPAMRLLALDVTDDPNSSANDKQAAAGWMAEAASRGDAEAVKHVEMIAEARRRQNEERAAKAKDELVARAKTGDVRAMFAVGAELYLKTTPEIHRAGVEWLRQAAEKNDLETLKFVTQRAVYTGIQNEDVALAILCRERLAHLPNRPDDAFTAGHMHLMGRFGLKPDRALAMPFLEKAVRDGHIDAAIRIAEAYDKGIGGPRDVPAAIEWYRKALPYEHPEFGLTRAATLLSFSRILLEPESNPKSHAQELIQLWDANMLDRDFATKSIAILAADALASGILGMQDPDREIFYLSRAVCANWSSDENAERFRVWSRFGEYVVAHAGSGLRIVVKEGKEFKIKPATKADGIWFWCVATFNAPDANVDACMAAAYTALSLPPDDLKAANHPSCAFDMFDSTADKFDASLAWYESARLLLLGKGVPRDATAAKERLLKAWEKGVAGAALLLAIIQQKKMVPDATEEEGYRWIKRGAEKGDPDCMRHHGLQLLATRSGGSAGVEEQKKEGVQWLNQAIAAGNADALDDLADSYESGNGVAKDDARALELLAKASVAGCGSAKRKLATRMAEGQGMPKDQKAALKLMFDAAQSDLLAAGNLGVVLWRGDWGDKDVEDGLQWMEVALERGFWPAGRNLAKIYHLGLGITANEEKARVFLERAGVIGGLEAAKAVAELYAKGEVIAKDDEASARWFSTASRLQAGSTAE